MIFLCFVVKWCHLVDSICITKVIAWTTVVHPVHWTQIVHFLKLEVHLWFLLFFCRPPWFWIQRNPPQRGITSTWRWPSHALKTIYAAAMMKFHLESVLAGSKLINRILLACVFYSFLFFSNSWFIVFSEFWVWFN